MGFFVFMVLYSMASRNCVYTGKKAGCTDKVIPKEGGDEVHNWTNSVPCSIEYKEFKGKRPPTEKELEACSIFYKIEMLKQELNFLEKQLHEVQQELLRSLPPKKTKKTQKDKEIELAYQEKEIKEVNLDKVIEKKRKR